MLVTYKYAETELLDWPLAEAKGFGWRESQNRPPPIRARQAARLWGEIKTLARFVGENLQAVPEYTLTLFEMVIDSRKSANLDFRRTSTRSFDPLVWEYNLSHQVWIDGLVEALIASEGKSGRIGRMVHM
ncbi:hypothetical protein N7454_006990 [Penicillium verhagenii]|nr:hypothetical protein N7454_006990 [Penicillium verhagenii]